MLKLFATLSSTFKLIISNYFDVLTILSSDLYVKRKQSVDDYQFNVRASRCANDKNLKNLCV